MYEKIKKKLLLKWFEWKLQKKNIPLELYQKIALFDFSQNFPFRDKTVLEIGSDLRLNTARAMLAMGAKEVYAVNFSFDDNSVDVPDNIHKIKAFGEDSQLPDEAFDIVFGIALLEHVVRPYELVLEIRRLLKTDGVCFLNGSPVWTSHCGHHIYLDYKDGMKYRFYDESSPFDSWEHLLYDNQAELAAGLKKKNMESDLAETMARWIYNDDILNRHTPTKIIEEARKVSGIDLEVVRYGSVAVKNSIYSIVRNKYAEEDLMTEGIAFWIRRNDTDSGC